MSFLNYFRIQRDSPWGTTGDICINGMILRERIDGMMQLHRAGPCCPPMTLPEPRSIVLTDGFKCSVEQAFLHAFSFLPVHKCHVARIPWHEWKPDEKLALSFNGGDDIEGIIDSAPHDERASSEIGPLWEVKLLDIECCRCVDTGKFWEYDVVLLEAVIPKQPLFVARRFGQAIGGGFLICAEQMKDWLISQNVPFIKFDSVAVDDDPGNFE
jgi:hypothetical protein